MYNAVNGILAFVTTSSLGRIIKSRIYVHTCAAYVMLMIGARGQIQIVVSMEVTLALHLAPANVHIILKESSAKPNVSFYLLIYKV